MPPQTMSEWFKEMSDNLDKEKPEQIVGLKETAKHYGFNDVAELLQYWESDIWKPYAQHIIEKVVEPSKAKAAAEGIPRKPVVNLAAIEIFLILGETGGQTLYSDPSPNFDQFEPIDHYCWAIYHIRRCNTNEFKGLFYGLPHLRDHKKLCLIWTMLQSWYFEHTPSRLKRREQEARKRKAKAERESGPHKRQKVEGEPADEGSNRQTQD